jgi:6-phosphogluconolactonase (cycloisomerase 2 family)
MVQTNGANTVPVSGNGTVLLATLPSGTTYTVTVSAQPTVLSQTCTVTGPGPNTLTANVTLPITCVTNHYNIIATVSGLAGTGLHLQVAPTAAVAATANATPYTLASVLSGGSFTVTVPTQPTAPTQSCVPVPATGNVTNADVPVAVTCTTFTSTVAGTISGLTGTSGLVLKDTISGHTTATLAAGTTSFAITPAINSGVSYNVIVLTQPTTPGQFCTVTNGAGTVVGTAITNVAVTCRNEGVFAFVADTTNGSVTTFTIDDSNTATAGELTQATGGVATGAVGSAPVGIVAKSAGAGAYFLYTADSGTATVTQYAVAANGTTTVVGTTGTGTGSTPTGIAIDPQGNFLLVTDSNAGAGGSGDGTIDVFQITAGTGVLTTQVANSPFLTAAVGGVNPVSVAVDPTDSFAYAANIFNPGLGLAGFTFDKSTVDATPGNLTPFGTNPQVATGTAPIWVTIDPVGPYVYVANNGDGMADGLGTISGWKIGSGGALTVITGSPFNGGTGGLATNAAPTAMAIDPTGKFLYVTDGANDEVVAFTINQLTGALTALATGSTISVPTGSVPGPLTMDPSGHFVYVGNTFLDTISEFYADPTTGELSSMGTSPLTFSGMGPNAIAVQ